jgi:hypothetical protein
MRPLLAGRDLADTLRRDAVSAAQVRLRRPISNGIPDGPNRLCGQFGVSIRLAPRTLGMLAEKNEIAFCGPALRTSIRGILSVGREEQMRWFHAPRIVAAVAHAHAHRDGSVCDFPRRPMGRNGAGSTSTLRRTGNLAIPFNGITVPDQTLALPGTSRKESVRKTTVRVDARHDCEIYAPRIPLAMPIRDRSGLRTKPKGA